MPDNHVTEAEASIMLELEFIKTKLLSTYVESYIKRITNEWFDMRRALGADPYDKRSCLELIQGIK